MIRRSIAISAKFFSCNGRSSSITICSRLNRPRHMQQRLSRRALTSSSSSPRKVTSRIKRDFFILSTGICSLSIYTLFFTTDWDDDVQAAQEKLLLKSALSSASSFSDKRNSKDKDNGSLPPLVVRRYIESVLDPLAYSKQQERLLETERHVQSEDHLIVSIQQSGEFYAAYKWYPFHNANLLLKASGRDNNIGGFVWDIQNVKILTFPHHILQSYINGIGTIITKLYGKLPLLQIEEEEPYYLFYLAFNIPCNPTSLLTLSLSNDNLEDDFVGEDDYDLVGSEHHNDFGNQGKQLLPPSSFAKIRFIWDNDRNGNDSSLSSTSPASSSSKTKVATVKAQMEVVAANNDDGGGDGISSVQSSSSLLFDVEFMFVLEELDKINGTNDELNLLWLLQSIKVIDPTKETLSQPWQVKYSDYNNDSRSNHMIKMPSPTTAPRIIPQLLPSTIEIGKVVVGNNGEHGNNTNSDDVKLHLKLRNHRFQLIVP